VGRLGQARSTSDKGWGRVTDFSAKGWGGYPFLSRVKEKFEESSVKRSILPTLVATKAQKRQKLTYLSRPVLRDSGRFGLILANFGRFWVIFSLNKALRKLG
jgi:hypothetical protein